MSAFPMIAVSENASTEEVEADVPAKENSSGHEQPLPVPKKREMKLRTTIAYDPFNFEDPIPANFRERLTSLKCIEEKYEAEERKRKRDISDSSIESICEQVRVDRMSEQRLKEFKAEYERKIEQRIQARIELAELRLKKRMEELDVVISNRNSGKHEQFSTVQKAVGAQIKQIRIELVALKRQRHRGKGELLDDVYRYQLEKDIDIAVDQLLDSLVCTYAIEPAGRTVAYKEKKRQRGAQSNFRRDVIEYYGSLDPRTYPGEPENNRGIWCPILKRYLTGSAMKAAHIIPHSIGEANCSYLFGSQDGQGHLMSAQNGLMLAIPFEKALDLAQIAIVPVEDDPSNGLQVIVFYISLLKRGRTTLEFDWSSLHGLHLEFKNDNRPRLRYLYFTFIMNVLRRKQHECTGWMSDLDKYTNQRMWGSPDKWLRGASMRAIARRMGHSLKLEEVLSTPHLSLKSEGDNNDTFDDDTFADTALVAYDKNTWFSD